MVDLNFGHIFFPKMVRQKSFFLSFFLSILIQNAEKKVMLLSSNCVRTKHIIFYFDNVLLIIKQEQGGVRSSL